MDSNKLQVVFWKWKNPHYRDEFDHNHVNKLKEAVKQNLHIPHEYVCITDDGTNLDKDIRVIKIWSNPCISKGNYSRPNCYARLKAFSDEMKVVIGPRFVWIDLDCLITGDITSLFDNDNKIMFWKDPIMANNLPQINGSMILMNAGTRKDIYENFDPIISPEIAESHKYRGSDQAWISYCIRNVRYHMWDQASGVYSFKSDLKDKYYKAPPKNCKIIFFHGEFKPWDPKIHKIYPWISRYYML